MLRPHDCWLPASFIFSLNRKYNHAFLRYDSRDRDLLVYDYFVIDYEFFLMCYNIILHHLASVLNDEVIPRRSVVVVVLEGYILYPFIS